MKRSFVWVLPALGMISLIAAALIVVGLAAAQGTPPPVTTPFVLATAVPFQPTSERPPVTPQDLVSLSGVGGTPLRSNVRIRLEPSLTARQIGILRFGRFIDIVGTNGFDTERTCTGDPERDYDMWVQVFFREQRGWIARCTLEVYGDMSRLPIEAEPEAVG